MTVKLSIRKKKWFLRLLTYTLHGKAWKFLPACRRLNPGKKISVGKSNGSRISVENWAVIWDESIFYSFKSLRLISDLGILCSRPFSHHVKSYSFMFLHKISTRVVCVNGKHSSNIGIYFWGTSLSPSGVEVCGGDNFLFPLGIGHFH